MLVTCIIKVNRALNISLIRPTQPSSLSSSQQQIQQPQSKVMRVVYGLKKTDV